ncbi:outer membrane protein [Helicobacter cetorum]|uniref:Hop family adhesin SabA n=1 Tax=Helicobacter cetorum TaxID=138563 RepID=UPI000CF101B4|nr:outer membrane protein [Helicobacter cetorum]
MIKKNLALVLALSLAPLSAEENGFFVSVGYQIGEAQQIAKNTGAIQKLNDSYAELQNNLVLMQELNRAVNNANDSAKITESISSIQAFSQNNQCNTGGGAIGSGTCSSTNGEYSPTYQASKMAISMALMLQGILLGTGNVCKGLQSNCYYNKNSSLTLGQSKTDMTKATQLATQLQQKLQASPTYANLSNMLDTAKEILTIFGKTQVTITGNAANYTDKNTGKVVEQLGPDGMAINQTQAYKVAVNMVDNAIALLQTSQILNTQASSLQKNSTANTAGFASQFQEAFNAQEKVIQGAQNIVNAYKPLGGVVKSIFEGKSCTITETEKCKWVYGNSTSFANPNNSEQATQQSIDYYNTSTNNTAQIVNDVTHLGVNKESLKNTLSATNHQIQAISNMPNNNLDLKNLVTIQENTYSPGSTISIDVNQQNALNNALQAMSANPFRHVGILKSQINNGAMNGFGVMMGYKQFFGKQKRWGARYYGFFDYNHAYIKSGFFNSASNVLTYGVGSDLLYNIINAKKIGKAGNKFSFGLFGGIQLAGTSWLNSNNLVLENNPIFNGPTTPYKANVKTSNFQFLFNLGLRVNLTENKKTEHAPQHGFELGVKIPTINTNYYSFMGSKLEYRRLYSIFANYVFAY